jgi:hypothetical protein
MGWTGSAWIDASDSRIGLAAAGVTNEQTARIEQDKVNASAVNTVWGYMGSDQNLVQEGATISLNPNAGVAKKWQAMQNETTGLVEMRSSFRRCEQICKRRISRTSRATASYGLQVSASTGGKNVIAGMKLYAQANSWSACINLRVLRGQVRDLQQRNRHGNITVYCRKWRSQAECSACQRLLTVEQLRLLRQAGLGYPLEW